VPGRWCAGRLVPLHRLAASTIVTTPFFASTLPGLSAATDAVDAVARSGRLSVGELLDHLRHALVVLDAQGRVVGHNLTALQLLELPEDLLRAQPTIDEVMRGQHARGDLQTLLQRVWYHLKRVQATAEPHVYTFKRPSAVAPARRGGSAGKRMPAITAIDSRAIAASASYAPRNGAPSRLRVWLARLGPATAPIRPPASTNETAFSRYAGDASSPAAKR